MPETDELGVSPVREGDVLAGKYRIERVLGTGGMGVVVAARHLQLDERVAIKLLLPVALEQADAVTRFLREAKAAVRIKSEHVVHVSDVGTLDNGAPYMVMEYLDGCDLGQWLQRHGVVEIEQGVEFILQALEAIADAHALGIIHRDLKPANLYCVRRSDGVLAIKVLDFGISKVTDHRVGEVTLRVTAPASMMGSPFYMSPEQMRSARDVDTRADIWAVGVILYELLTGTVPFSGDTISSVSINAATLPPQPIADFRLGVPAALERVILKCLEKDPARRYHDVAELAAALRPFAPVRAQSSAERVSRIIAEAGLAAEPSPVSSVSSAETIRSGVTGKGQNTLSSWGKTNSRRQFKRGSVIGVLALASLVLVGAVGWAFWRGVDSAKGMGASPSTAKAELSGAALPPVGTNRALVSPVPNSGSVASTVELSAAAASPAAESSATAISRPAPANVRPLRNKSAAANQAKRTRPVVSRADDLFAGPQ